MPQPGDVRAHGRDPADAFRPGVAGKGGRRR